MGGKKPLPEDLEYALELLAWASPPRSLSPASRQDWIQKVLRLLRKYKVNPGLGAVKD